MLDHNGAPRGLQLQDDTFVGLRQLESLSLAHTHILNGMVPAATFRALPALQQLNLMNTGLSFIVPTSFVGLAQLVELYVRVGYEGVYLTVLLQKPERQYCNCFMWYPPHVHWASRRWAVLIFNQVEHTWCGCI